MTTLAPLFTWRSAISASGLPATSKHTALALSLYMNERGGSAFPGVERLVADTGLSRSTVKAHLHRLVESGWLDLIEEGGQKGQRRRANHYGAAIPDPALFSTTRSDPDPQEMKSSNEEMGAGSRPGQPPSADPVISRPGQIPTPSGITSDPLSETRAATAAIAARHDEERRKADEPVPRPPLEQVRGRGADDRETAK